jgi:ferritin-like metal-binding protein YciE
MQIANFTELYLAELQELHSMKDQLADAHQRFAEAAQNPRLSNEFLKHHKETEAQIERIDDLLARHDADGNPHTDQATQALVREAEKMIAIIPEGELRDVALIASAQKIAHYEIAAFGSAAALAGQLDQRADQKVLHTCLQEEKRADNALTKIAKGDVNPHAVAAA